MANEHPAEKYRGKSVTELVNIMARIQDRIDKLDEYRKELYAEYDAVRKHALPEAMQEEGISSCTVDGVGRVTLRSDIYASIPASNREAAFDWLRGTGHGGVIKESIHHGTLKALIKEMIRSGEQLPPEDLVKVTPYDMAVLTRSK